MSSTPTTFKNYHKHDTRDMDTASLEHIEYAAINIPTSLLSLLSNTLVLYQTAPYLPPASLLALGAISKDFRHLIHDTPNVFRYLDLTRVKAAQSEIGSIDHGGEVWRNVQLDENVTEDESVDQPLYLDI